MSSDFLSVSVKELLWQEILNQGISHFTTAESELEMCLVKVNESIVEENLCIGNS